MEQYLINNAWILLLIILWTLPWKGVALWKAGRNGQKIWFIALLMFNTLALLPIVYLFYFSKKKIQEIENENN
jgi:methionyl-tRNA synthetase